MSYRVGSLAFISTNKYTFEKKKRLLRFTAPIFIWGVINKKVFEYI